MKNFVFILIVCLITASCSESDDTIGNQDPDSPDSKEDIVKISLHAAQSEANIFELIVFNISPSRNTTFWELKNTYDSLVWNISGVGRLKVFSHFTEEGYSETELKNQWSHNFFEPKNYKTVLLGYKDNKIILADTASVDIKNQKDFLEYNWSDITSSSRGSKGYNDAFEKINLATYYTVEEGNPSINLFSHISSKVETESISAQKTKTILYNHITAIYSNPSYSNNSPLLESKYDELFKTKRENATPLNIWLTPTSNIVLLEYHDEYSSYPEYEIHAEPKLK